MKLFRSFLTLVAGITAIVYIFKFYQTENLIVGIKSILFLLTFTGLDIIKKIEK